MLQDRFYGPYRRASTATQASLFVTTREAEDTRVQSKNTCTDSGLLYVPIAIKRPVPLVAKKVEKQLDGQLDLRSRYNCSKQTGFFSFSLSSLLLSFFNS